MGGGGTPSNPHSQHLSFKSQTFIVLLRYMVYWCGLCLNTYIYIYNKKQINFHPFLWSQFSVSSVWILYLIKQTKILQPIIEVSNIWFGCALGIRNLLKNYKLCYTHRFFWNLYLSIPISGVATYSCNLA